MFTAHYREGGCVLCTSRSNQEKPVKLRLGLRPRPRSVGGGFAGLRLCHFAFLRVQSGSRLAQAEESGVARERQLHAAIRRIDGGIRCHCERSCEASISAWLL
jgi:hypothetical protein